MNEKIIKFENLVDEPIIIKCTKKQCEEILEYSLRIIENNKDKKSIYLKEINKYYCTHCEALHITKEDAEKCCD